MVGTGLLRMFQRVTAIVMLVRMRGCLAVALLHRGFHTAIKTAHFAAGAFMVVTFKLDGRMTDVVLIRQHCVK